MHASEIAVLIAILATLVVTPVMIRFFSGRVARGAEAVALGKTVLVPVRGESSRELLDLAGRLAAPDGGIVVPASLGTQGASPAELAGLLRMALGESATLLVAERIAGGDLEPESAAVHALVRWPVPVLLASGTVEPFHRLVLIVRRHELAGAGRPDLDLAAEIAGRLAHGRRLGLVTPALEPVSGLFAARREVERVQTPDPLDWIARDGREGDRLIFGGLEAAREALRRIPALRDGRFLVAIAARGSGAQPVEERVTGPVVVGRSLTPSPA
jgi:hypothetical protein